MLKQKNIAIKKTQTFMFAMPCKGKLLKKKNIYHTHTQRERDHCVEKQQML